MSLRNNASSSLLQLPPEITFKILEFIISEEFYCSDICDQDETKLMEMIQRKVVSNTIYNLFEELKDYLLVHRDLFYNNFINIHCNRQFLIIWKRILYSFEYHYKKEFKKEFILADQVLSLIRECKTGDELSTKKLIIAVFSRFNSPECILETFFNVKCSSSNSILYFSGYNGILGELMCKDHDCENWKEQLHKLDQLLIQYPSLTQNPKYSMVIIQKMCIFLISKQIYSNIIRATKKKRDKTWKKKAEIIGNVFTMIFSKDFIVENSLSSSQMQSLSIVLATIKVVCSSDLFDKIFSRWILNSSNRSCYLNNLLFTNTFSGDCKRFKYCIIESFIVHGQFKELERLIETVSKLPSQPSSVISSTISEILSIYFDKIELFQLEVEKYTQQVIDLILACWNLKASLRNEDVIDILQSLTSTVCTKALQVKDDNFLVELFDKFYFTLFSKEFLCNRLILMESILLQSNILLHAIQNVRIFEHLMNNVGNQNTFKKQLTCICQDSTIYSKVLSFSVSYESTFYLHNEIYKMRTESPFHDTIELFEKRLRVIKKYLNNISIFKNTITDQSSKFNETLEQYTRKHNSEWKKNIDKLKGIITILKDEFCD